MEVLPNELLIECFSYLDALHIFYSFDELNSRVSTLIRSIPLYVDFCYISMEEFCNIYMKLISDVKIKKQIYSLKITNQNPFHKQIVQSVPLIDEFIHLRSLSLIDTGKHDDPQWSINFSSLPELCCFHTTNFNINNTYEILSELPMSQMRILTLQNVTNYDEPLEIYSSITNLTISNISADMLCELLKYATKLRCLHLQRLYGCRSHLNKKHIHVLKISNCVKRLTIENFNSDFAVIARVLKRTPYLIVLTLIDYQDEKVFNVYRWQSLIRFSLKNLTTFNFTCTSMNGRHISEIQDIFQRFQTDFWLKKHQWYTGCFLSRGYSTVYTIPYIESCFELKSVPHMYSNEIINRQNIFTNVKNLQIYADLMTHRWPYYFPNVTTIEIGNCCLTEEYFELLKANVNLTNLTNLHIKSNCKVENSSIFLELLKQSPYILSLSIELKTLLTLLDNNDQLCEYLSNKIKNLTLISTNECNYIDEYVLGQQSNSTENKLWKTFAYIEQLKCKIEKRQSIRFLLESLSNLSFLDIHVKNDTMYIDISYLEEIISKLDIQINSKIIICTDDDHLHIWISKKARDNHKQTNIIC